MDPVRLLKNDHRNVELLLEQYLSGGLEETVREIVKELSIHTAIEEQYLYPEVRRTLPDGDQLAEAGIDEHQTMKELLAEIERLEGDDAELHRKVSALQERVARHVEEEEQEIFPKLQQHSSPERLAELGESLEHAKSIAPTHPHRCAPARPPGNMVAGPATGVVDRIRDAVAGKDSSRTYR